MNNRAYEMDHEDDLIMARAEGIEIGREEGTDLLISIVQSLRSGQTAQSLIASGISPNIIEKAMKIL